MVVSLSFDEALKRSQRSSGSCLEHGNSDNTSEAEEASAEVRSGTGVLSWGRVGGRWGLGHGAVASRSLDLTVGDLRDGSTGRGLDLTVGDLGDWRASWGLDLTIGDLRDWGASWGLNLTVGDLRDWRAGRGLDLAVTDLGDWRTGRSLNLTVTNLGDGGDSRAGDLTVRDLGDNWGGGDLAVRDLRSGAAALVDSLNVDWAALLGGGLVVKVVEGTAQALVESGVTTNGERAVVADGPARGVDSILLDGVVELELLVGDDGTGAALVIGEDTILKGDGKSLGLTLLECHALGWGGLVDDLNLEGSVVVGRALARGGLWHGVGGDDGRKGERSKCVKHVDC